MSTPSDEPDSVTEQAIDDAEDLLDPPGDDGPERPAGTDFAADSDPEGPADHPGA